MGQRAKGTQLGVYASSSYNQIVGATDITWSGTAWDNENITNHDATTPVKQFQTTLYSNGDVSLTLTYDPTNTYHQLLRTLSLSGAANQFQLTQVDSVETAQFSGYVMAFAFETPVGGILKAKIKIVVNGAFTIV